MSLHAIPPSLASPHALALSRLSRGQVCSLVKILDLLSRAEALRGGFIAPGNGTGEADAEGPATAASDGGSARHRRGLLRNHSIPRSTAPGVRSTDGPDARRRGLTSTTAGDRRQEELELLRQAVQMEDALGYDEPPALPVPTRLYLAAALIRENGNGEGNDGGAEDAAGHGHASAGTAGGQGAATATAAAVGKDEAEEAETVLRELDVRYPNMGRTLLGLWRACSALGKDDDAQELRERFVASWQYSEVWLVDSAHVGGVGAEGQADVKRDFNRVGRGGTAASSGPALGREGGSERANGGNGRMTNAAVFLAASILAALSVVAAVVVAARRRTRARLCTINSFNQLPWEWKRVGAVETEETTNVAQPQAGPWPDIGRSTRKGYRTIGEPE